MFFHLPCNSVEGQQKEWVAGMIVKSLRCRRNPMYGGRRPSQEHMIPKWESHCQELVAHSCWNIHYGVSRTPQNDNLSCMNVGYILELCGKNLSLNIPHAVITKKGRNQTGTKLEDTPYPPPQTQKLVFIVPENPVHISGAGRAVTNSPT